MESPKAEITRTEIGADDVLLRVRELKKYFPVRRGVFRRVVGYVKAVDGIDFDIHQGETLGLVGESGCGKTTTGRVILRLIEPTAGEIRFKSRSLSSGDGAKEVNITELSKAELKMIRKDMQVIFQDPYSSLNPRMTVGDIVGEPLIVHKVARGAALEDRVVELLEAVGLKPDHMRRYPHEFSGGQRQRIGVARALALDPQLIIADEPVSALDVSIQAQVLNLLEDLQEEFGLTYLFIAHDLSVVEHISDRVAVMYLGKVVELADAETLYQNPKHPYTEALLSAIPVPDPDWESERIILKGSVPSPVNPPSGCNFHPRCPYVKSICSQEDPELRQVAHEHFAACHFAETLELKGIEE
ncbi:MAG: ABC transporter ATP-binding protein [Candidatus Bipolaricaulia bacterium]